MHQVGDIINQKYKIIEIIGEDGNSITYSAIALATNTKVAIKTLSLQGLSNWKQIELFEREAKILSTLDHPAIPKYIDYFYIDHNANRNFYIVQQLATGKSLFQLVQDGWRTTEAEIKSIAKQTLEIIVYLHGLVPPVIHRDIKPQNIIRREDGKIFLVDFGAVQNSYYANSKQGSTVVGTYGYMAPEQFRGQAVPGTDLYSLGATLVYLLTHYAPAELPHSNLKINFRDRVQISNQFATWLDKILEPNVEDRFTSAQSALTNLGNSSLATKESFKKLVKTKINMVAVGLAAICSAATISMLNSHQPEVNKIIELEKNSAQLCQSPELAQYYLENGGNPNLIINSDRAESSLLLCLLTTRQENSAELLKTIKLLIDNKADLEVRNNNERTPLQFVLSERNQQKSTDSQTEKIARLLIDGGANIDALDSNKNTPLILAMLHDYQDIAEELIAKGAKINTTNKTGITPAFIAVSDNNLELVKLLANKGADLKHRDKNGRSLLFEAAAEADRQLVDYLITQGIEINLRSNLNQTALFEALNNHNYQVRQGIVETLIESGANINLKDNYAKTPLFYAASSDRSFLSIVELLLNEGAEVNVLDNQGFAPLFQAVHRNSLQIAKLLIAHGADVNLTERNTQQTPLFTAVSQNNLAMIELLVNKAEVNVRDRNEYTPIFGIVNQYHNNSLEIAKLLIANGSKVDLENHQNQTLLSLLVDNTNNSRNTNYLSIVELLIANGANVNFKDGKGRSILLKAAYSGNEQLIKLLKQHGAKY